MCDAIHLLMELSSVSAKTLTDITHEFVMDRTTLISNLESLKGTQLYLSEIDTSSLLSEDEEKTLARVVQVGYE